MTGQAADPDADAVLEAHSSLEWTNLLRPGSTRRIQPSSAASWKSSIISDIIESLSADADSSAPQARGSSVEEGRRVGSE
jgi:hypothetical protein